MLSSAVDPERTLEVARAAEEAGVARLWVTEDYFRKGGFSSAAAVLAATERLEVGLGVVSVFTRHPAVTAMEAATIGRMFPGRFAPGVGLGVPHTLERMGLMPAKIVGSMRTQLAMLRALLTGEKVTASDEAATLEEVALQWLPTGLPLHVAASGPLMLRFAAREADGLILSILSGPGYVEWVLGELAEPLAARATPLEVTVFAYVSCDPDAQVARMRAREFLATRLGHGDASALLTRSAHWHLLEPLMGLPPEELAVALPDECIDDFTIAGDVEHCRRIAGALLASGATELALCPIPTGDDYDFGPVLDLIRASTR